MPSTVNGIGTTYYGHSNVNTRLGACRSCGHTGTLESYDTRLWFVIIFIPVIPLGRKRIIDQCSHCQRHYVASKDQYEMSRQLGISAAQEQFREHPTPEAALELHATLLAYHDHEGAAAFSAEALKQFPQSGELCVGLASHMEQVSRYAEAAQFYEKAFELRPDLPQVRDAQARKKINENKLEEARDLLDFLMHPGAGQTYPFGTLDQLAFAYQKLGRHEETLELYQHLLNEFPHVGEQHNFRKVVKVSEKALGRHESILPRPKGGWLGMFNFKSTAHAPWVKWTAIGSVVSALVLVGLYANNEYKRRHQTIHVLNAFPEAATVQVDNEQPNVINGRGELTLAEGPHHIKVSGPVQEELDINPQSTFFDRWLKNPAWVLNVGRRSVLCEWTITYALNAPPSTARVIANEKFVAIPNVDYIFTPPPNELKVDNRQQQVVKTHLDILQVPPESVFHQLKTGSTSAALQFAEIQLPYYPANVDLLHAYLDLGKSQKQGDRIEAYLNSRRSRRPIEMNIHRFYQEHMEDTGRSEQVIADYRQLLQADPGNAALLYLTGRIEPDDAKYVDLLKRSTEADSTLPWAWYGLAARASAAGDWAETAIDIEKARERKMDPAQVGYLRHLALLATGGAAKLEQEYSQQLKATPSDFRTLFYLCDVLAATNRAPDAKSALAAWEASIPATQRSPETIAGMAMIGLSVKYMLGEFEDANAAPGGSINPATSQIRADMLLAAGQANAAAKDPQLAEVWKEAWNALDLSIAFGLESKAAESAEWRIKACELFDHGSTDERRVAKLLRAEKAPALAETQHATHQVSQQLRLLAALAVQFPDSAQSYGEEIAKLNVSRVPSYHLVKKLAKPTGAE